MPITGAITVYSSGRLAGQRTKITYPDSKTVDYTYLADGRMSTVTDWQANQTAYTYDDAGRLTKTQYPNTVWTDYTYDATDRLTSVVNQKTGPTTISSFTYTLDSVGNRTQMVELSGTHSYQYDSLYRLNQVTYPGPVTDTYSHDANGNRAAKNVTSYTYDAADEMTAAGAVTYGYDNNGNQTSRGSDTFTYDHENRLTQTVISGATSSSTYNGDGLRMSHTVGLNATNYDWDVSGGLPVILQERLGLPPPLDLVQATYVYGLDLISSTDSTGSQTYYLYDGLGSTTGLTDGSGSNPVSYTYDVFGAIRSQTGTSANFWLFTGEQRDADSSLYFLRARYYDPAIGRFLSQDPVPGGNLYAYVDNNPTNLIDPSGLCPLGLCETIEETLDPLLPDKAVCVITAGSCAVTEWAGMLPEGRVPGWFPGARVPWQLGLTCAVNQAKCDKADELRAKATAAADGIACPDPCLQGTRRAPSARDKFRHCFGSGSMTLEFGASFAEKITKRYEAFPQNNRFQREYDIDNNRLGREFAEGLRGDPDATSRLRQYCKE